MSLLELTGVVLCLFAIAAVMVAPCGFFIWIFGAESRLADRVARAILLVGLCVLIVALIPV